MVAALIDGRLCLPKKKANSRHERYLTAFARLADQARSRIEEISAPELARAKPLPVIIDVRESDEYTEGRVQAATHSAAEFRSTNRRIRSRFFDARGGLL